VKLAVISSNLNFWYQFDKEFRKHHVVRVCRLLTPDPTGGIFNGVLLGKLCQWSDMIWIDFAQDPFQYVLDLFPSKHIVVRIMRIEVYNEAIYLLDWNAVDLAIFVSEHMRQRFFDKLQAANARRGLVVNRPMRSVVIPGNMYDPERFSFAERKFEKPYRASIVGHLVPKKRVYTLVQMFAELPPYFTLDIAGGPGMPGYGNLEYEQNIRDLIEILGLGDRVRLVGEIPHRDMPAFLKRHDILVSNCNEEGDALNVTEAAACGCYPLINCWRGAEAHYGKQYVFKTVREFVERVEWWASLPRERKVELSKEVAADMDRFKQGPLAEKARLLVEEIAAQDKMRAYYDHTVEEDVFQGRNERVAAIDKWAKEWLVSGMEVLSLGCGIGLVEESLAEVGVNVLGVDLSGVKIEAAKERTRGKPNLRFLQGDARDPKIGFVHPPQFFEAILMNDFIEHIRLEDQEAVLQNVDQLTPLGFVMLNIPSPGAPRGGRTPQPIDEAVEPQALIEAFARHGFDKVLQNEPWLSIYHRLVVSR